MIKKDEVFLRGDEGWLHFADPFRVVTTSNLGEVRSALREVEACVSSNHWHAAGFISYEASPAFDTSLVVRDSGDFPLVWFGLYPAPAAAELPTPEKNLNDLDWQPTTDAVSYNTAIDKIKDLIARGRTYQVNYTLGLRTFFPGDEWNFFLNLVQSQNRYAAYIDTGRYAICSASPELFFRLDGETVTCRPMKGTVDRGRTTLEDKEHADWLQHSIKNRAENVMIVDMIRNDLGKVAEIGSVIVPDLFTVEKYATLFQMTSTVQARTRSSLTDILSALFPCASITGAPKISTMKIIANMETTPRKIYTGAIGHIAPDRKARFNVAIRTALIDRDSKSAEYGIGGGIVWDSTASNEFQEALLKSRVLRQRIPEFSLIETLLWTPEQGFFLFEKHRARLEDSAEYFDFRFSPGRFGSYCQGLVRGSKSPQRVKILLNRFGELAGEAKDFQVRGITCTACLAREPVDSANVFLFHKTTQRDIYEEALVDCADRDDVLLYNERDELTEFTIGNLVVELDGHLITPPVSCGLLPGTFRQHLLESGQIEERIIEKGELDRFKKIFLINSVRKWVEVTL